MTNQSIKLEPNWQNLFNGFSREVGIQADHACATLPLASLRAIQGILAPIAIALNAAASLDDIERLRTILSDASGAVSAKIDKLDAEQADPDELCAMPECGNLAQPGSCYCEDCDEETSEAREAMGWEVTK
jgi:hypothetical protein